MDDPLCRDLYAVLILFQSLVETFLIREILIATTIPFTINNSNIILLIASVFTFSCDKIIRTTSTYYNYSFLSLLPNLPLSLYNHIFKILCVPASRQSKEFYFFDLNLPKKMELGLEFHKTNPRIRISILEI